MDEEKLKYKNYENDKSNENIVGDTATINEEKLQYENDKSNENIVGDTATINEEKLQYENYENDKSNENIVGDTGTNLENRSNRKKISFSAITILGMLMIVIALLTWFVTGKTVDGSGNLVPIPEGKLEFGLLDIFQNLSEGFISVAEPILFLIIVSGFSGVIIRTGAIQALMHSILKNKKTNPRIVLAVIMILVALISTLFNATYLLFLLAIVVIPLLAYLGYDIITGLMALLFGSAAGIMSSLFSEYTVGTWVDAINRWFASQGSSSTMEIANGILYRVIIFILMTLIVIVLVDHYGKKVIKDKNYSLVKDETEHFLKKESKIFGVGIKAEFTGRNKAVLYTMLGLVLLIVVGVVPFHRMGFTHLNDFSRALSQNYFAKIIWGSQIKPFGEWTYHEIGAFFLLATIIITIISRTKQDDAIEGFTRGMKSVTRVVVILIMSGGIYKMLDSSGIHVNIMYNTVSWFTEISFLSEFGDIGLPIGAFIVSILAAPFFPIIDNMMIVNSQIFPALFMTLEAPFEYIVYIGSSMAMATGAISIILPTSAVTLGLLMMYKVSYKTWLISTWKYVGSLLIVSLIMIVTMGIIIS